jgi:hypothetical protein
VLLYGDLMKKMLSDLDLWEKIPNHRYVGNYRLAYYQKRRKEFSRQKLFANQNPTLLFAPTWNDFEGSGTFFEYAERLFKELPSSWNLIIKVHPDLESHDPAAYARISLMEQKRSNFLFLESYPLVYPILEQTDAQPWPGPGSFPGQAHAKPVRRHHLLPEANLLKHVRFQCSYD